MLVIEWIDMSEDTTEQADLGPIATRLLFEDERVRVWDQVIEPGATTGPHRHECPYALVTVEGADLEMIPVPGYPLAHGEGGERLAVTLEDQSAGILPGGAVEDALNVGDRPYRAILVEFKQG